MSGNEKVIILGFLSFHPDGYLRQKAISEMHKINNNKFIPFLLIRLNDWVVQVRTVAKKALVSLLHSDDLTVLIDSISQIKRLEACGRDS